MTASDWVEILKFILWITCIVYATYFGREKLSNDKKNAKLEFMQALIQSYVQSYEKTDLTNTAKKQGVIADVASSLKSKGFSVSAQTLSDIDAMVERAVDHMKVANNALDQNQSQPATVGTAEPIENVETQPVEGLTPAEATKND